ncbi:MAG: UDP-3-O-(3-hydroxymyristoyl)glucosamine N-acyltransferase, partial [Candidatus Acidiferrales bacterium]
MKLSDLATQLGCTLEGDGAIEITGVAGIEEAQPGQLTFLANPRYRAAVKHTRASAILIAAEEPPPPVAALRTANPYFDFARALELFYQPPAFAPGIHQTAVIAPSARIGASAHIGPYCFVDENVEIGRNAVLHSHVVIYREARIGDDFLAHSHAVVREHCRIGNRVILQNGAAIGGDGFGFAKQADGRWYKIVQSGITVIEDDVEV